MTDSHRHSSGSTTNQTNAFEPIRHERFIEINATPGTRAHLIAQYGQVWDPRELANDFEVIGFISPFVAVRRKADDCTGTLEFQCNPRFYFSFLADRK
jgi:hypothetical protein